MNDTSRRALILDGDLLEYAKSTALKEARKRCPRHLSPQDVAQETLLRLFAKPPQYDPTKGASEKTFLYTVIRSLVSKLAARERKRDERFEQAAVEPADHRKRSTAELTLDDFLRFIDCEESRALCRLFVECKGNKSEVARRMGLTEGAVRNRLRLLAPKMIAAGFDPTQFKEFQ